MHFGLHFAQRQRISSLKKVELDDPTNRHRHYHPTSAFTINSSPSASPSSSSSSITTPLLERALYHSRKIQPLEASPKAPASRQPHRSHYVFKLHLHSNTDTFSTQYHLQLVCLSETALLSSFETNNTPECPPQVQLPHRTHLTVLPSSLGEESLRQSPRLLGAESTRPP